MGNEIKRFPILHNIKRRLALLSLACVAPVWIASGFFIYSSYVDKRALIERHMVETARALAMAVDRQFMSVVSALQVLSKTSTLITEDWKAFYKEANDVLIDYPGAAIVLADASAQQFVSTLQPFGPPPTPRTAKQSVDGVFRTGKPQVSNLYVGHTTGIRRIAVDVPVVRKGVIIYDLGMNFPAVSLQDIVIQQRLPIGWIGAILDRNWILVARNISPEKFVGRKSNSTLLQAMVNSDEAIVEQDSFEGDLSIFVSSRSQIFGYSVVIGAPKSLLLADARRWTVLSLISIFVVTLIGVMMAVSVAKGIVTPIQALVGPARDLGQGKEVRVIHLPLQEAEEVGLALTAASTLLQARNRDMADALNYLDQQTSALKEQTTQLQIAKTIAEEANRTKSAFLAMMSHEIRTPLTGIIGTAEFLDKTHLNDDQRTYLETMLISARTLLHILNDILDYSKIDAHRLDIEARNFDVVDLVGGVLRLFSLKASQSGTNVSLDTDAPQTLMVMGDPTRIKQVLGNLLSNAVKFTSNGTIIITLRHETIDSHVRLRFEVSDTGIGISEQDIGRLFEPFSQAESGRARRYGGTGLGLAISKRLVELMGGEIGVRSQLAKGSTFWFTCLVESGTSEERKAVEAVTITVAPMTILLAEDNSINRMIIRVGLEQRHHQVAMVENGLQAYEAAASRRYDAILMDMQMPVMDGVEATRRIRTLPKPFCDVPIVALTADALAEHRPAYMEAGLTDFVTKPIAWSELDAVLLKYHGMQPARALLDEHPSHLDGDTINLPIFDHDRLAQIKEMMTPDDIKELIIELLKCSNDEYINMCEAVKRRDINASRRIAHIIKGMFGNLGAIRVAAIAKNIQDAETIIEADSALQDLKECIDLTVSTLVSQL